jgi:acetyltransferase-like isoleucine patch superfamily enzyme
MQSPYFSKEELLEFGFKTVGENTQVSRKVSIYGVSGSIGNRTRIDDFCILKGRLEIGACVHIAAFVAMGGHRDYPITCKDCSAVSSHSSIFTGTADYRAAAISNPTVEEDMQANIFGPVTFEEGVVVGAHCVVLPNVVVGYATSVGANLVIHKSLDPGKIIASRNGRPTEVGQRDIAAMALLVDRARKL